MKTPTILAMLAGCVIGMAPAAAPFTEILQYGDGQADGRKSLGGSGELVRFSINAEEGSVAGLLIHGSRYGQPDPGNASFLIYLLSEDLSEVLHTEIVPYRLFERGSERWVDVAFHRPQRVPQTFWVALDFRANRTRGVYVSYDRSTGGRHSKAGLPGLEAADVEFGGDWMIRARLTR